MNKGYTTIMFEGYACILDTPETREIFGRRAAKKDDLSLKKGYKNIKLISQKEWDKIERLYGKNKRR
jgi:hypothetical protein